MGKIVPRDIELKTGEKLLLRSAVPDDASGVLEYVRVVLTESEFFITCPDEFRLTVEQETEYLEEMAENPSQIVIVAEVSGKIIGTLHLRTEPRKKFSHLGTIGLGLLRKYRNQGIGTAMLNALIDWAVPNPDLEKLCLSVFSTNGRAIHLYEKMGFKEEGRRPKHIKTGADEYVDDVLMYRFVK